MRRVVQGRAGMVLAFMLGLVIATAGTATAARLITGQADQGRLGQHPRPLQGRARLLAKRAAAGPAGPARHPRRAGPVDRPGRRRPRRQLPGSRRCGPPVEVQIADPAAGVSCLVTFDTFCGTAGGDVWTAATGGSYGRLAYFVEPAGFVQFQGTAQQVGHADRRPASSSTCRRAAARA